jgi:hypothetical protein
VSSDFDAELYLRLAGEKELVDSSHGEGGRRPSPLSEAACALLAVGAVRYEVANHIARRYDYAQSLRSTDRHYFRRSRTKPPAPVQLTAPRIVVSDQELTMPWGKLHVLYVSFGGGSTTLGVRAVEVSAPNKRRAGRPWQHGRNLNVTDDSGTTAAAVFGGGSSSDGEWEGHLDTRQPLSVLTRWIDIDGVRLDLPPERPPAPAVRIEPLDNPDPAANYLWLRLATADHWSFSLPGIEAAIDALCAAGAVDRSSPLVDEVRDVAVTLAGESQPAKTQRQPWRSLTKRASAANRVEGVIAIGVVTPPVDGVTIRIDCLVASDEGWETEITTSPSAFVGPHTSRLTGPTMAWWAADDRGNHYLGHTGSWSSNDSTGQGTVEYQPALDPKARELHLLPTGASHRAVITLVDLPWVKR